MFRAAIQILNEHKVLRGMLSYATLWPMGSLIEQTLVEKRNWKTYDWKKCLKFSAYGGLLMGPTMYVWVRIAAHIWPRTSFRSSLSKAFTELCCYDPLSICTFMFVMSLFENKSIEEAEDEVRNKFLDTYKVGIIYWPTVQTINFTFVPIKNQVVCTSFSSMIWSAFLAYEKHLEIKRQDVPDSVSNEKQEKGQAT